MADTWGELTMPFAQAYTPLDQLGDGAAPTILSPNDPKMIVPKSAQKKKVTGPGVLGGVGPLGAVDSQPRSSNIIDQVVQQASYATALTNKPSKTSLLNPKLGFMTDQYDLRNASISPGAIQKALSHPDRPTNAAPPPPAPDLTDYTEPGYITRNYYD